MHGETVRKVLDDAPFVTSDFDNDGQMLMQYFTGRGTAEDLEIIFDIIGSPSLADDSQSKSIRSALLDIARRFAGDRPSAGAPEKDVCVTMARLLPAIPSSHARLANPLDPEIAFLGSSRKADLVLTSERKMDFGFPYHSAVYCEVKPMETENQNSDGLRLQARRQVLSSSADRLKVAVREFRAKDVWATSITLTPHGLEVQLMRVRFQPDEQNAYIAVLISEQLPIFRAVDQNEDVLPAGLEVLWRIMNTPSERLASPFWSKTPQLKGDGMEVILGDYLGAGSSGAVFACGYKGDGGGGVIANAVAKVYFASSPEGWTHEVATLRKIHEQSVPFVPEVLFSMQNVEFDHGKAAMLGMRPAGESVQSRLRAARCSRESLVHIAQIVQADVLLCLQEVHSKCKLAHLDVRPANIVLVRGAKSETEETERAYLIDWGTAKSLGESTSFRGCMAFASAEMIQLRIAKRSTASVTVNMDLDSLILTLAAILAGGSIPWDEYDMCTRFSRAAEVFARFSEEPHAFHLDRSLQERLSAIAPIASPNKLNRIT